MKKEKYQRRHEMLVIDCRKGKLEEWRTKLEQRESNLRDRETRVIEAQKQIDDKVERANQELALIEMATIQKQQAITVIEDLKNKYRITESQIVQLIKFASEWDKYWTTTTPQQPGSPPNLQQPGSQQRNNGSNSNSNGNNGYGGGPSMNDLIRLNLLQTQTTKMFNRMGPKS